MDLEGGALPLAAGARKTVPAEAPRLLLAAGVATHEAAALLVELTRPVHRLHEHGSAVHAGARRSCRQAVRAPVAIARLSLPATLMLQDIEIVEKCNSTLATEVGPRWHSLRDGAVLSILIAFRN